MDDLDNFDPNNVDEQTIIELRERYNSLIDDLNGKIQECGDAGVPMEYLKTTLRNADDLFLKVKRCPDARLDAQLLKAITSLGKANIEKTQSNLLTFRPFEFAENLVQHMKSVLADESQYEEEERGDKSEAFGEIFWARLGMEVTATFTSTAGLKPLYGALDLEPPERIRRERQSQNSDPKEHRILSQNVATEVDPNADNVKGEEVLRINKCLHKAYHHSGRKPIPYYEFVIDPTNFSATIENMFHVSFLIRDGYAEISLNKHDIPVISPIRREAEKAGGKESSSSKQAIFDMSLDLWKEFVEVLELSKPMVPSRHRSPSLVASSR